MKKTSQISGFYKLTPEERIKLVKDFADLTEKEVKILQSTGALDMETADRMIENVVGTFPLPLGIAMNFLINNKEYSVGILFAFTCNFFFLFLIDVFDDLFIVSFIKFNIV